MQILQEGGAFPPLPLFPQFCCCVVHKAVYTLIFSPAISTVPAELNISHQRRLKSEAVVRA